MSRLARLMEPSGGIYFGDDAALQHQLAVAEDEQLKSLLTTVRFRCTPRVYRFLREGLQRFPLSQMRLSKPLPAEAWRQPAAAPFVLDPTAGSTHPYPMEIEVPAWTVARDVDFRRWLFGYGAEVLIEAPQSLRSEHREHGRSIEAS